jgi:c-di-GMP-binding flagellar brake protein YcgR
MDHRSQNSSTSTSTSAAKSNRRTAQRAHLHVKADVTLPGDLTIVGHTLDISAGGLSIEVPYELKLGQRCEIELNLSKMGGPKWIQVIGEVRYCSQADDDTFRAGLQFVDVDDKLKETLDQCIWSRVTGPPPESGK